MTQTSQEARTMTEVERQTKTHEDFIANLADLIVWMDQEGMPKGDRDAAWTFHGITKREVEEAEEQVEERYQAAGKRFKRKSRRTRW